MNSFHARIDILQTFLGLALASQGKPEVKPRDIVVLVLSQRFLEVETGECQYGHDHPWGKCPPCEDKFAVGKPITFL